MDTPARIFVNDICLHAYHGVLPQERLTGNDYRVSVSAFCPALPAVGTDDVRHTVNYAEMYRIVREEMGTPSNLVEHVAGRIARHLLRQFAMAGSVHVSITKLNPPMGGQCAGAGVELDMTRAEFLRAEGKN